MESAGRESHLETAKSIALDKGSERRQEIFKKINSFWDNIKKTITRGVDFALGSPDAAMYLGKEAVKLGEEKAMEVKDSVVEAGTRAWENTVDIKDRLVKRGMDAKDRLVTRFEKARDATQAKVADLSKKAAAWGLTHIIDPIENRLQKLYELPENIQLARLESDALAYEVKAISAKLESEARHRDYQERIKALLEAIDTNRQEADAKIQSFTELGVAARTESQRLYEQLLDKRAKLTAMRQTQSTIRILLTSLVGGKLN